MLSSLYVWHVTLLREQLQNTPWRLLYHLHAAGVVSELNVRKIDLLLPVLKHTNTFPFDNRVRYKLIFEKLNRGQIFFIKFSNTLHFQSTLSAQTTLTCITSYEKFQ